MLQLRPGESCPWPSPDTEPTDTEVTITERVQRETRGRIPRGHVGDLGNVRANETGVALVDRQSTAVFLSGSLSSTGRAMAVHISFDDYNLGHAPLSATKGNAGAIIACASILLIDPTKPLSAIPL